MRIDVGQAVAGGEVFEPAGNAVRVHVVTVVLGKDIAGSDPGMMPVIDKLFQGRGASKYLAASIKYYCDGHDEKL